MSESRNVQGGSDSETHLTKDGNPDRRFKEFGGGNHGNQAGGETDGFEEVGDGASSLNTEDTDDSGTYK
ncbi:hypothetical protein HWV62_14200 [Athelia sp. TMB]|nr:hypothetical protein HWV62_14200 [Athelia sp. TMB]